jgi:hypothetical protein
VITPERVQRIAAVENPVLRNLAITQCYAELSAAVTLRVGQGANWCTFATWASRQAGRTIRGEDALDFLRARLGREGELLHPFNRVGLWLLRRGLFQPETRLGRLTARLHTPFDALERASGAVARGNLKVFAEIGLEFARYLEEVPQDAAPDSPELTAFVAPLPERLGKAFTRYQRERFEEDRKLRTELVLLANLEIGNHEQERLQPEIHEALDAPYITLEDLGARLLPPWLARRPRAARAAGRAAAPLQRRLSDLAHEAITHSLMVLSLPGRILALGTDLPDPYPEALRVLVDAELKGLVAAFEPAAGLPDHSGAHDWADLRQRMHYIVHLFRAFHASEDILGAPFTPEQLEQLEIGVIPSGDL